MNYQVAGYQTEGYRISTPVYEGPLDLLLELIERAELDITKLAIAQVTDQYLEYLKNLQDRNPAEISAFLVMAARLVQIKSIALLPRPTISAATSEQEEDPAEALARQLKLYKRFKELSNHLGEREASGLRTYLRVSQPNVIQTKFDLTGTDLADLLVAARNAFHIKSPLPSLDQVVNMPRVTIRERIEVIMSVLRKTTTSNFHEVIKGGSRVEIVVSFLALLELVKRRIVDVKQSGLFGQIELQVAGNWDDQLITELEFKD